MTASIFVSYASADRDHVERLVGYLETHHLSCWVSFRDVGVGENYQEAITRALRAAKILIVLVTHNANSSAEIQKELSLASRYNLLVIPLRIEEVEPNDALSYELATRQWVDMFRSWSAGCDRLLSQLRQIMPSDGAASPPRPAARAVAPTIAPRAPMPAGTVFVPPRLPAGAATCVVPEARPASVTAPPPPSSAPPSSPPAASVRVVPVATSATRTGAAGSVGDAARPRAPAAAIAPTALHTHPDEIPPAANRIIGVLSLLLFAVAFVAVAANALQRVQTPYFELVFWAILLFGCARLFGAILRAMVRAAQHAAPSGG